MSGVYTVHMSLFDVGIVLSAGLLGYFMKYFNFPFLPAVLGVVLGTKLIESNYRRSLVLSGGDFHIFLEDPIAVGFFIVAALIMFVALFTEWRGARAARKASPA